MIAPRGFIVLHFYHEELLINPLKISGVIPRHVSQQEPGFERQSLLIVGPKEIRVTESPEQISELIKAVTDQAQ